MAKVLSVGDGQAIRLPKGFRFDVDEVCIKRVGTTIIIFSKASAMEIMADTVGKADVDFIRHPQGRQQKRNQL